ncbi:cation transporter [Agromyces sp. C10]|uniref:cation transporter n=1 Tax=Agromyces sp. C10 TaxID=2935077 RepID=UPI00200BA0AB|nr:cation transporter [Agromyces sp. C10]MCK8610814.1 cation transporter [Agromyces sp. C10]
MTTGPDTGSIRAAASAIRALAEERGLKASMWLAIVLSVTAIGLGIWAGSRVLVLVAAVGVIGVAMSWLALRASRAADAGPTERYPYGRDGLTPLVGAVQGLAVGATIVFAASDAVIVILNGGQRVSALAVAVYALVAAVASVVFAVWLRRNAEGSELIVAEASQWNAAAVRRFVIAAGAALALVLALVGIEWPLDYIDPVLVLVACALIAPIPIRMLRRGVAELLEGQPDGHTLLAIERAVDGVAGRFDLPGPEVRSTKLGAKLYVDVVFVLDHDTATIGQEDEVRRAVISALAPLPFDVWATVELTADPALAE